MTRNGGTDLRPRSKQGFLDSVLAVTSQITVKVLWQFFYGLGLKKQFLQFKIADGKKPFMPAQKKCHGKNFIVLENFFVVQLYFFLSSSM